MNYKKLKPKEKLKHVSTHIVFVQDYLEGALFNLKMAGQDVNIIRQVCGSEEDKT